MFPSGFTKKKKKNSVRLASERLQEVVEYTAL